MVFNVLSLFDGISCGQIALNRANIKYDTYIASEVNKYAIKITQKNYPFTHQIGSVVDIDTSNLPNINLLMGGSPCQDLSCLKNGLGLMGSKSKLFFEYFRILKEIKPTYFLFENVVPRKKEWQEQIDTMLGTTGILINSDRFINQNRPRIYCSNIPIAELPPRPNWNTKYFQWRRTYFRENKSGVCPCLTANMGTGGHNVPLKSPNLLDKLSPEELEILQTIPKSYTEGVSNSRRYEAIGNSWTVDVITHILNGIKRPEG